MEDHWELKDKTIVNRESSNLEPYRLPVATTTNKYLQCM